MKKLLLLLGLFLMNNAFARGVEVSPYFFAGALLPFFVYASIMTYKSPNGKKLKTFICSFFLPPLFWIILFVLTMLIFIKTGIGGYWAQFIYIPAIIIIPIILYYIMKNKNFFKNDPE